MLDGEIAAILEEVLAGRQLRSMTPDERDNALSKATRLYKSGYRVKRGFEDYLVELGAKALARFHKFDPDAAEILLTDGDMRKKRMLGTPNWHRYRDDARVVVRAMFDRNRFQELPITISVQPST